MTYFAGGRHLSTRAVVFVQQMAVEQEEERAGSGALRFNLGQSSCKCRRVTAWLRSASRTGSSICCSGCVQEGEPSEPHVEGRASRSFRLPRNTLAARTFVQHIDEKDHFLASPSILQLPSRRILVLFEKCGMRTLPN